MKKFSFLMLIFLISGCYTSWEHPDIKKKDSNLAISFSDDCAYCHSDSEIEEYDLVPYVYSKDDAEVNDFYTEKEANEFTFFYNSQWWYANDYLLAIYQDEIKEGNYNYGRPRSTNTYFYVPAPSSNPPAPAYTTPSTRVKERKTTKKRKSNNSGRTRNQGQR